MAKCVGNFFLLITLEKRLGPESDPGQVFKFSGYVFKVSDTTCILLSVQFSMVLILNGNLVNWCERKQKYFYLFCIRYFLRLRIVRNLILFTKKPIFFHACAPYYQLPFTIATMFSV